MCSRTGGLIVWVLVGHGCSGAPEGEPPLGNIPEWQIVGEPILVIGAAESPTRSPLHSQGIPSTRYEQLPRGVVIPPEGPGYSLAKPRSSLLTREGELFLIEGADATILRFNRTGQFIGRFGRLGGGPGEYKGPRSLRFRGDSLVVWDEVLDRLSVLTLEGRLLRTIPVFAAGYGVLLWDGRIATLTDRGYGVTPNPSADTIRLIARNARGAPLDTLLVENSPFLTFKMPSAGGYIVGMQPFEDGPIVVISDDGARSLRVDRKGSASGKFRIAIRDLRNGARVVREFTLPPTRVGERLVALAVQARMHPGLREKDVKQALFIPDYLPPVSQAFFLPDEKIVLRGEETFGGRIAYRILDPDGRPWLDLTVPANVTLTSGYGSRLLFMERDRLDLPTYRIVDFTNVIGRS